MLDTLNLYSGIVPLFLNKTGRKKKKENISHLPPKEEWKCNSKEHTLFQEKLLQNQKDRILQADTFKKKEEDNPLHFKGHSEAGPSCPYQQSTLPHDNGELSPKFRATGSVMQECFTQPSCIQV